MIDNSEVQKLREQLAQQNLRLHGVERKFPVWAQNRGISRERHIHDLSKHKIGSFGFGGIVHYDYTVDPNAPAPTVGTTSALAGVTLNDAGGGLTASETDVTYAGSDLVIANSYIYIDSEAMYVQDVSTISNTANVVRGQLSTTATTHTNGAQIYSVVPAGKEISLATGGTTQVLNDFQAALCAADADNDDRSIRINDGTFSAVYSDIFTIPATFAHQLYIEGESPKQVRLENDLGIGATQASGFVLWMKNVTIPGFLYTLSTTTNAEIHLEDCRLGNAGGDWIESDFRRCLMFGENTLAYGSVISDWTPDSVSFSDCYFVGSVSVGSDMIMTDHFFSNCVFNHRFFITDNGSVDGVVLSGCSYEKTSGFFPYNWFDCNTTGTIKGVVLDGFVFAALGGGSSPPVHVTACGANSSGLAVVDCTFPKTANNDATIRFIQCDTANLSGWVIVGNSFQKGSAGNDYAEDDGAISIRGIFVDSVIGPNSPPDFALQADAGTATTVYFGTGAVTGAGAASVTLVPGATGLTVEEDNVAVVTNTASIDFAEPDGTLVTGGGTGEAEVNMALYAKLAGRSGGQTLIGGTATGAPLYFRANAIDSYPFLRVLPSGEAGTSTGANDTTLTDAGQAWVLNQWVGATVTSNGKTARIASNTATVLTGVSDSGTANAAVTTTATTLTDTRKAWVTNEWVGYVVTYNATLTMTVTSNTATTLTGAAWSTPGDPVDGAAWSMTAWTGGSNPGSPQAYTIAGQGLVDINTSAAQMNSRVLRWMLGTEANPRLAIGWDNSSITAPIPQFEFGAGGASATELSIKRAATNVFNFLRLNAAAAPTLRGLSASVPDTQPRWEITGGATGRIAWGTGGTNAVDTALTRVIANVVKVGLGTTAGTQPGLELPGPNSSGHIVAPTSLGTRIYSAVFANRTRLFCINDNGIIAGPIGYPEGVLGNVPLCGLGAFGIDANNLVTTPWGCLGGVNHVFNTRSTARIDTGFTQLRLTTNATAGTVAGSIASRAGLDWPIHTELNGSPMLQVRFAIDSNANIRLFIGWTNLTLSQMVWKDEPGDAGTADAAVTFTATTMTDTREAWTVNEWVGAILLNYPTTTSLVVTSNTATTITGTAGWTNGTPAAGSAWSLGQYLGLQYSSGRGDTTWQFIAKEALGTFTRVDTLIGVTDGLTSSSIVRITHDTAGTAGAVCELFGPDRVSLGAAVSMIASLAPEAANDMRTVAAIETRTGATKTIGLEAGQEVIRGAL